MSGWFLALKLTAAKDKQIWQHRFQEINNFAKYLVDNEILRENFLARSREAWWISMKNEAWNYSS
jgi:hypothetical protein